VRRNARPAVIFGRRVALGAGFSPILDGYTTGLWAAWGISRLLSSYGGACLRVRDSTTTSEFDIGFAADGRLDQADLSSKIGSNSATVVKFYDQTGNSRDLAQATSGQQPRIVNAGVYDGLARFDGVDDCLQSTNLPGTNTGMTYIFRAELRVIGVSFDVMLESTSSSGALPGMGFYQSSGSGRCELTSGTPSSTNFVYTPAANAPADDVMALVGDRTAVAATDIGKIYKAGAQLTPSGSSGGSNTGNYDAAPLNVGARNNGASLAAQFNLKLLAVYTSVLSDPDIAAISAGMIA
jgi:hypothetical protein